MAQCREIKTNSIVPVGTELENLSSFRGPHEEGLTGHCESSTSFYLFVCFFFIGLFIYFGEKERTGEEAEGERKPQGDSTLSMEPYVGLDLRTLRS